MRLAGEDSRGCADRNRCTLAAFRPRTQPDRSRSSAGILRTQCILALVSRTLRQKPDRMAEVQGPALHSLAAVVSTSSTRPPIRCPFGERFAVPCEGGSPGELPPSRNSAQTMPGENSEESESDDLSRRAATTLTQVVGESLSNSEVSLAGSLSRDRLPRVRRNSRLDCNHYARSHIRHLPAEVIAGRYRI